MDEILDLIESVSKDFLTFSCLADKEPIDLLTEAFSNSGKNGCNVPHSAARDMFAELLGEHLYNKWNT